MCDGSAPLYVRRLIEPDEPCYLQAVSHVGDEHVPCGRCWFGRSNRAAVGESRVLPLDGTTPHKERTCEGRYSVTGTYQMASTSTRWPTICQGRTGGRSRRS